MSITELIVLCLASRQYVVRQNLFTTSIFEDDVSRNAMKVADRIADVGLFKFRQSLYHSIDRFIGIVFRITQTFGDEDAYQAGTNHLVSRSCFFAIGVEPLKQSVKWVLGDGQLSANSLELGIDKTCAAKLGGSVKAPPKASSDAGQ